MLLLKKSALLTGCHIIIPGSKSETNRLLFLQALYPQVTIKNESDSDDSTLLKKCLYSHNLEKNVEHCGAAMRFLTAFFASKPHGTTLLTGSQRMQERPVGVLVEALRCLGASIEYVSKEGFPPLMIYGKELKGGVVKVDASVSSQFVSALMLVAPIFSEGLEINLSANLTSRPYVLLTLQIMKRIGIPVTFQESVIKIPYTKNIPPITFDVESDWSSASYFYALIALGDVGSKLTLSSFRKNSLQGDSEVTKLFNLFGVATCFEGDKITLEKTSQIQKAVVLNLNEMPDLAQTVAVTCLGLGLDCHLTGLQTLRIKETDRLLALQIELTKFGVTVNIGQDYLQFNSVTTLPSGILVETYNDHRMALSFAVLCLKTTLQISNPEVVSKSFPTFWNLLQQVIKDA